MSLRKVCAFMLALLVLSTGCSAKKEYPQTFEQLSNAVAGESKASLKYSADAKKAADEGFAQVARLFEATAMAEGIHADRFFKLANAIGTLAPIELSKPEAASTEENLKAAIDGETYEYTQLYPQSLEIAKKEGNKKAEKAFSQTMQVEQVHSVLYTDALTNIADQTEVEYYVCKVCGNIEKGKRPWFCPICGAPMFQFEAF